MPELGTSGSVRGVCSNAHPYRNKDARCWSRLPTESFTRSEDGPVFIDSGHGPVGDPGTTTGPAPSTAFLHALSRDDDIVGQPLHCRLDVLIEPEQVVGSYLFLSATSRP